MPTYHCPADLVTMDIQVQPNLHYRVNGGHESSAGTRAQSCDDDTLQFLSREEKECILFFEETIDSLEEALKDEEEEPAEDQGVGLSSGSNTPVEGVSVPQSPVQASTPITEHSHSPRDNDIIDLVHSTSHHSGLKEPPFEPNMPDFQSLAVAPETHFEMKAKRDPMDNFPPEYHIPASGEDGSSGYQPPPGSIPTPVLIAHKLAEHQGDSSLPSMLLKRRRSLDSNRAAAPLLSAEHPAKQGPPTSAKPNINLLLGTRDLNHAVAMNAQERRAQMLANLGGAPHPMEGGEPPCVRNLPTRSVSFRDPTPDKSRMEALSKLGLVRGRAKSVTPTVDTSPETKAKAATTTTPAATTITTTTTSTSAPKTEIHTDFNRFGGKSTVVTPSAKETPSAPVAPASADVASRDFNSFGGKTIVVVPAPSSRAEPEHSPSPTSPPPAVHSPPPPAKTDTPAAEINSYGSRTKTIIPASALARADITDGPASHQQDTRAHVQPHSPSPPAAVTAVTSNANASASASISTASVSSEVSHFGAKSKLITPAPAPVPKTDQHQSEAQAYVPENRAKAEVLVNRGNSFGSRTRVVVPTPASAPGGGGGARGKSSTLPPMTAPKPPSPHRVKLPSPEVRRKASKPSFRSQGITVQFSGRGATDESRREALRKLGLLKESSLL